MSSTATPTSSVADLYRECAARLSLWTTKLHLALSLCDQWEVLDPKQYPLNSAVRAAKAMELVTQTVSTFVQLLEISVVLMPPF